MDVVALTDEELVTELMQLSNREQSQADDERREALRLELLDRLARRIEPDPLGDYNYGGG
jgi:hypothetical protein